MPNILLFQGAKPMARFNHTDRTLEMLTSFIINQTGRVGICAGLHLSSLILIVFFKYHVYGFVYVVTISLNITGPCAHLKWLSQTIYHVCRDALCIVRAVVLLIIIIIIIIIL